MRGKNYFKKMLAALAVTLLFWGPYCSIGLGGTIEISASSGVLDNDGITPLVGDGLSPEGTGCIIQCIYAGPIAFIQQKQQQKSQ